MSCCNTYNVGCSISCGLIELPLVADSSGQHILELQFMGVIYQYSFNAVSGSKFSFPSSILNESGVNKIRIIKPNNQAFSFVENEVSYTCFSLNTSILMTDVIIIDACVDDYLDIDYWADNYLECA